VPILADNDVVMLPSGRAISMRDCVIWISAREGLGPAGRMIMHKDHSRRGQFQCRLTTWRVPARRQCGDHLGKDPNLARSNLASGFTLRRGNARNSSNSGIS
jgi:hypothetical protein